MSQFANSGSNPSFLGLDSCVVSTCFGLYQIIGTNSVPSNIFMVCATFDCFPNLIFSRTSNQPEPALNLLYFYSNSFLLVTEGHQPYTICPSLYGLNRLFALTSQLPHSPPDPTFNVSIKGILLVICTLTSSICQNCFRLHIREYTGFSYKEF